MYGNIHRHMVVCILLTITTMCVSGNILLYVVGAKVLSGARVKEIFVEDFLDAEASAEGSHLALYTYDDMKGRKERDKVKKPSLQLWRYVHAIVGLYACNCKCISCIVTRK